MAAVKSLSADTSFHEDIERMADDLKGGIIADFRKDFPEIKGKKFRFFLYRVLGFTSQTISLLLDIDIRVVYNNGSALRKKISASELERREEYLSYLEDQRGRSGGRRTSRAKRE